MSSHPLQDILKNDQKVVFLTGAAQGIGSFIANCFAQEGYFVAFADVNREKGVAKEKELHEKGFTSKYYYSDLSDEKSVRELAEMVRADVPQIDVIVNNAKIPSREKEVLPNIENEWDDSFKAMLKHPILFSQLVYDLLQNSKNASIIFIGSTNAFYISQQPMSYHVVKGALLQTTRYLACEYGKDNIRVNLLHPGVVDIPDRVKKKKSPQYFDTIERVIPLKRIAMAEEVGHSCVFLASDQAKYITGISMNLDGGEHLKDHFHLAYSNAMNGEIS